jgi:hypothetical protein
MIEYGHKRALEAAHAQLRIAALEDNQEAALVAAKQAEAVSRSARASEVIFQELNVPDIPTPESDQNLRLELAESSFNEAFGFFLNNSGYTQTRFAQLSGLSDAIVSRLLTGNREPGLKTFSKIVGGFGWTLDNWEARFLFEKALEHTSEQG